MSVKIQSLQKTYERHAIRWGLYGLGLILIFSLPFMGYLIKDLSEKHIRTLARAATVAFRPMIVVNGNARDAQFQFESSLGLRKGEYGLVLNPQFEPIYPLPDVSNLPRCKILDGVCWSSDFSRYTILEPIYFDDDRKEELYGYLELSLVPSFQWGFAILFVGVVLLVFAIQAFGISSALRSGAELVTDRLSGWAKLIRVSDTSHKSIVTSPFTEFSEMEEAILGLHDEITRLKELTAKEAKSSAQLSLLKELGHDLGTPLHQVRKYWELHEMDLKDGDHDPQWRIGVKRALTRVESIIRNLRTFHRLDFVAKSKEIAYCDLSSEGAVILSDLQKSLLADCGKKIEIKFTPQSDASTVGLSPSSLYQIIENLIKNSVEALPETGGIVEVRTKKHKEGTILEVIDNGPGIPAHLKDKIFEPEVTSKPGKGTGLGLGIVKRICDLHKATIEVSPYEGRGTRFAIVFGNQRARGDEIQSGGISV